MRKNRTNKPAVFSCDAFDFVESVAHKWAGIKRDLKATQKIEHVLKRNAAIDSPESALICAVLGLAAQDIVACTKRAGFVDREQQIAEKRDAVLFFNDGRAEGLCDAIGLSFDVMMASLKDAVRADDPQQAMRLGYR